MKRVKIEDTAKGTEDIACTSEDKQIIELLQKNVPLILDNNEYFDQCVVSINKLYSFSVDRAHFRKKLNLFLRDSFCREHKPLGQSLIHGRFHIVTDEKWLWIGGREIALLTEDIIVQSQNIHKADLSLNTSKIKTDKKKLKGAFIGLAIGDAMGAPVEFVKRGAFAPVTAYKSGGKFRLNAGEWTDDTAMALCLAQSLLDCQGFDPIDQMEKYLLWMHEGYMSCTGKMVGLGKTCMRTLIRYRRTKQAYTDIKHEKFSGNGSLMRLAPVCIYYADNIKKAVHYAALSSKTTHGSPIAIDACRYFCYILVSMFSGMEKKTLFLDTFEIKTRVFFKNEPLHQALDHIIAGEYQHKKEEEISSSGYVIHSLEAALWSFYHTTTFKDAILKAVNLGDDADTVGAITGQLAGAWYGFDAISPELISGLERKEELLEILERLLNH